MVRRTHGNSQEHVTKHIFVTGGVVSSLGKGLTASSLGRLLRSRGIHVLQQKLDPYINVDPGTMNPFQHGEVYVTEDGAETDLDIGHYERFLDVFLSQKANVTTGQIYQEVLRKERAGEYLGQCVQVIPHITNEIKSRMRAQASDDVDVIITEIGGTVGDIESQPFLEAAREVRRDLGPDNCMFVHVSLVPYISAAHELKTKPTQHSVMMLRQLGISPDALVLRSDRPLNQSIKDKISLMCDVDAEGVVNCVDAPSIYDVPKILFEEGLDAYVVRELGLPFHDVDWDEWADLLERVHHPKHEVNIAIVGKYVELPDAYLSIVEALTHGGIAHHALDVRLVQLAELHFSERRQDIVVEIQFVIGVSAVLDRFLFALEPFLSPACDGLPVRLRFLAALEKFLVGGFSERTSTPAERLLHMAAVRHIEPDTQFHTAVRLFAETSVHNDKTPFLSHEGVIK